MSGKRQKIARKTAKVEKRSRKGLIISLIAVLLVVIGSIWALGKSNAVPDGTKETKSKFARVTSVFDAYARQHEEPDSCWLKTIYRTDLTSMADHVMVQKRGLSAIEEVMKLSSSVPELERIFQNQRGGYLFCIAGYKGETRFNFWHGRPFLVQDPIKEPLKIVYFPEGMLCGAGYFKETNTIELAAAEMPEKLRKALLAHELYHASDPDHTLDTANPAINERGAFGIGFDVLDVETKGVFGKVTGRVAKQGKDPIEALNTLKYSDCEEIATALNSPSMGRESLGQFFGQIAMAVLDKASGDDNEWAAAYRESNVAFK